MTITLRDFGSVRSELDRAKSDNYSVYAVANYPYSWNTARRLICSLASSNLSSSSLSTGFMARLNVHNGLPLSPPAQTTSLGFPSPLKPTFHIRDPGSRMTRSSVPYKECRRVVA